MGPFRARCYTRVHMCKTSLLAGLEAVNRVSGKFPEWLRRLWASGADYEFTKDVVDLLKLHTVCQSARCPNLAECWSRRTATMMVLGNTCTRNCSFCSVPSGKPEALDAEEPQRVAEAVLKMGLKHTVVTTVVRDDLPDGGTGHIAETIRAIRRESPGTTIEILVSDYRADAAAIKTIVDAGPEVFSHNIETVERLYPVVRDRRFTYAGSLKVLELARAASDGVIVKSAMMVGHGETDADVEQTLRDLYAAGCEAVCIGQYLRPSLKQREVESYVPPERFEAYEALAYEIGFGFAVAGPFVRSSYKSEAVLEAPFARARLAGVG